MSIGGAGGEVDIRIKYANYIEANHETLLASVAGLTTMFGASSLMPARNPYYNFGFIDKGMTSGGAIIDIINDIRVIFGLDPITQDDPEINGMTQAYPNIDNAMFSSGYTIESYPSLWDMYGKFVAGLDIEVIYEQIYDDMMTSPALGDDIAAESALLDDELNRTSYPKLTAGMRDMNAVMSSSFIYGKSLLESDKIKQINKYSATLKMRAMELTLQRWGKHLEWNNSVIQQYMQMQQLFWGLRSDWVGTVTDIESKYWKWFSELGDFYRICIGALNGAASAVQPPKPSGFQQTMSNILGTGSFFSSMNAMTGGALSSGVASMGSSIAGMFGSAAGAEIVGASIPGAIGAVTVSSERYKENIVPLDSGDKIMQLIPVRFKYKGIDGERIGLIAEDVEKVIPEVVASANGIPEGLYYQDIVALLVKKVQDLELRVKELQHG